LHIFVLRYQYLLFYTPTFLSLLYALSLHDALPISSVCFRPLIPYTSVSSAGGSYRGTRLGPGTESGTSLCSPQDLLHPCATPFADRKSTRLNSSHQIISYAVFCLKKQIKQSRPAYI